MAALTREHLFRHYSRWRKAKDAIEGCGTSDGLECGQKQTRADL